MHGSRPLCPFIIVDMDERLSIFFRHSHNINIFKHNLKFLYEETRKCEEYTAIKRILLPFSARKICIYLSGHFTLLRCVRNTDHPVTPYIGLVAESHSSGVVFTVLTVIHDGIPL